MNTPRLLFTVDVEEDMPLWKVTDPITTENARALPKLHQLCEGLGARPTYLCDYPMITQKESGAIIRELYQRKNCEIGTHLHPWNTPPYNGVPGRTYDERTVAYYMRDLGADRFRPKLESLTNAITTLTGERPRSFRAGRYGIDGPTLRVVSDLGYTTDTSVTPLAEHTADGGPDFRSAPQIPYRPSGENVCIRGDLPIVEIPVSIALTRNVPRAISNIYVRIPKAARIRGLLSKDYLDIINYAWLYPVRFDLEDMKAAAKSLLALGSPVLNVFLHSSELIAGMSGGVHTETDVNNTFERLRGILEYCVRDLGAKPMTLAEAGREMEPWIDKNSKS